MWGYATIIENLINSLRKEFSMRPKQPVWEEPKYSGSRIQKAGKILSGIGLYV